MKCPHDGHECFHQCQEFGCERAKGKLTKHAQVGNTVFHAGVEEHMVIERAQREYEYHQSPEREAERKRSLEEFRISIYDYSLEMRDKPIAMLLWCPKCAMRHIDEGEFGTKEHHTHACQQCGMVWRPAIVNTVGVQFLPGFKNESTG